MTTSRALIALMLGVTGAILIISGVRDTHPAVTFQSLLQKGKLPDKGQTSTVTVTRGPTPTGMKPAGTKFIPQ